MSESYGTSYGGFPLYKATRKLYRCRRCGGEFVTDTNHFEPIYICKAPHVVQKNCRMHGAVSDCRELDYDVLIRKLDE